MHPTGTLHATHDKGIILNGMELRHEGRQPSSRTIVVGLLQYFAFLGTKILEHLKSIVHACHQNVLSGRGIKGTIDGLLARMLGQTFLGFANIVELDRRIQSTANHGMTVRMETVQIEC